MPRRKRIVIPGFPHHVTQRGCRRQEVFFRDFDREVYYELLKKYSGRYGVEILSHCLMTNHIHLLAVPHEEDSLRWTLQLSHKKYADYINAQYAWSGHLWQERFYSSPVDDEFLWVALRYIERNPVEAGLVKHPSDYRWSSARARCLNIPDPITTNHPDWLTKLDQRKDWHHWLSIAESKDKISRLRKRTSSDLPTGGESFLDFIEKEYGVKARPVKLGRPKKGNVVTVTI